MKININNLVSITEANQNFSKVARLVDKNGSAIILKNNKPRYILLEYGQIEKEKIADNLEVEEIAKNLVVKHKRAFEKLSFS